MRRFLDRLYDAAAIAAGCAMVAIFLLTLLQVAGGFSDLYVSGTDAYAGYAMASASFFALAGTLKRGEHIRVTLFIQRMKGRARRIAEFWCLGVAVFLSGFFAWYAWDMVYWSWEFGSRSIALDETLLWIPQSAMAAGVTVLCIAFVDEFVQVARGRDPAASDLAAGEQHTE